MITFLTRFYYNANSTLQNKKKEKSVDQLRWNELIVLPYISLINVIEINRELRTFT